jgi:hypothetical protein
LIHKSGKGSIIVEAGHAPSARGKLATLQVILAIDWARLPVILVMVRANSKIIGRI